MLLGAFASLSVVDEAKLVMVPLLILLTGFFIVLGAYFKVANLVQYISRSVITGYITAAALLIITNQIPKTLGLDLGGQKAATFVEAIGLMLSNLSTVDWITVGISLATAVLYVLLNWKFKSLPYVAICLLVLSVVSALSSAPKAPWRI